MHAHAHTHTLLDIYNIVKFYFHSVFLLSYFDAIVIPIMIGIDIL